MFCQWVESHRAHWNKPEQTVILFVDSAPTRGNLDALRIFQQHNVMVITFPPHLTHVLQPVDVAWARRFKSQFRDSLRSWSGHHLTSSFRLTLKLDGDLSQAMYRRAEIVGAAIDAAHSATTRSVCVAAFAVAGLVNGDGDFSPDHPLASVYVRQSDEDPEQDARVKQGRKRVFISSRVLTSDEAIRELEERKRTKPQRRAGRVRRVVVEAAPPPAGPDGGGFEVEDERAYEDWRQVAARTMPPDPEEEGDVELGVD